MESTISNTARSTRRWMTIAFIAGMVFTAVLAQTLVAVNKDYSGDGYKPASSGEHDSLTPAPMPDEHYILDSDIYGMVNACPEREEPTYG